MAKIKRSQFATFLNTGTIGTPIWSLIGTGATTATINYNPKVLEETYINQDSASISIESYAPTLPVELTAITSEEVFEYIDGLRKARAVLTGAETQICNVWLYEDPALGYYPGEKQLVSLQTDTYGGDGGTATKLNFTLNYLGEGTDGWYHPTVEEFIARPVNTILTTMAIDSLTLTPDFADDHSHLFYSANVPNGTTTVTMNSTLTGATIVQYDEGVPVSQGGSATLAVGINHLTISVTVGSEVSVYKIDITRAAA